MTSDPDQIRGQITQTQRDLSADVDALSEKLSPSRIAQRRVQRTRAAMTGMRERIMGSSHSAASSAKDTVGSQVATARDAVTLTASSARDAVGSAASSAADTVSSAGGSAAEAVSSAPDMVRQQPRATRSQRAWSRSVRAGSSPLCFQPRRRNSGSPGR
jgi:Protein of unknown function (DUF3618)